MPFSQEGNSDIIHNHELEYEHKCRRQLNAKERTFGWHELCRDPEVMGQTFVRLNLGECSLSVLVGL